MKRCPECGREYDNTMMFCLDDGTELLYGPARSEPGAVATGLAADEPQTAILHSTAAAGETTTRAQIYATEQTAVLQTGAEAEPRESLGDPSERQSLSAHRTAKPLAALIVAVVVLVGGFFGYRYFSPTTHIETIAVMPFVNESGNADIEYLSDGMTETLISSLTQLPNLKVKGRSSVFRYKGKDTDTKTLGKELGVEAVLYGRVIQRGEQLTLSLELLDAATENAIWSGRYDRKQSDVVSLQSEIARDVSNKLQSRLSGAEVAKVQKTYTADPDAYQLYLRGRFQWNRRTGESLKQAAAFFEQAIAKDPNYALAYAALAETYGLFLQYDVAIAKDCLPQARAAALKALELDNSLAAARTALAEYYVYFEYDRVAAERECRRAIELDPNYATAHHWLGGDVFLTAKRFEEAFAALERAEKLDPLSPIIATNRGDAFLYARRFDEAIAQYKRVVAFAPSFGFVHYGLGFAYWEQGKKEEAIAEAHKYVELSGASLGKGQLGYFLAKSGKREEARKLLDELLRRPPEQVISVYPVAMIYLGLGERDKVLELLEKDVESKGPVTNYYAVNFELDELRSEPRFKALLKRMNLPE
jgi:TolB-like protein/Tfp pilus assembly protein PilF